MGVVNRSEMKFKSGLNISNCYLCFDDGSPLPPSINMCSSYDGSGNKRYTANATLFVYSSQQAKSDEKACIEQQQVTIPVDPHVKLVLS